MRLSTEKNKKKLLTVRVGLFSLREKAPTNKNKEGPFEAKKKFREKGRTVPKKISSGDPSDSSAEYSTLYPDSFTVRRIKLVHVASSVVLVVSVKSVHYAYILLSDEKKKN